MSKTEESTEPVAIVEKHWAADKPNMAYMKPRMLKGVNDGTLLYTAQSLNHELLAQIERLREAANKYFDTVSEGCTHRQKVEAGWDLHVVLEETSAQSLNEIRAEAIESVLDNCTAWANASDDRQIDVEDIKDYAEQIRNK